MNPLKFKFLLFSKLPIAWIAGLKLIEYSNEKCSVSVKLSWLNQNPFHSMFWAVQGMAAELSSGVLCMDKIQKSGQKISMLVVEQKAEFYKKAKGKIIFTCIQGKEIQNILDLAISTKEGQTLHIESIGIDEAGDVVSKFKFLWSFKAK